MIILLILLILIVIALCSAASYSVVREVSLKRNNFICFEERGGTSLAMVKNGKVGRVVQADNGKRIVLTEKLYKIRKGWDEIYLYKYRILLQGNQKKKIQKKSRLNRLFLSFVPFLLICIAACSGGDTEIEVTAKPEPVEEVIPEPTPEPVPEPEVIYSGPFDFLESWADIDVANGEQIACNDRVFTEMSLPDLQVTDWNTPNPITTQWHVIGAPVCSRNIFYSKPRHNPTDPVQIHLSMRYPDRDGTKFYSGPGAFFLVKNRLAGEKTEVVDGDTITQWAVGGDLYGRFDPESQEAMDREELAEDCGRSAQYDADEDGDFFEGEWQAVKTVTTETDENNTTTTTELELCVKLDDMPSAVKCVVSEYDGDVSEFEVSMSDPVPALNGVDTHKVVLNLAGETNPIPVVPDVNGDYSVNSLTLYNGGDYPRANRLCNLFDDGPRILGPLQCEQREERVRCGLEESCQDKIEIVTYCFREEI